MRVITPCHVVPGTRRQGLRLPARPASAALGVPPRTARTRPARRARRHPAGADPQRAALAAPPRGAWEAGLMRTYGLRFDVNCSILFTELPLLERPAAAKAAGFDGVEFWWPWKAMVPSDSDADAFVSAIADAGVELVSLNFHTGDMAAGERGLVSKPSAA